MTTQVSRPDVNAVLGNLKDFQRDSVDYVFQRLYLDSNCTNRFLVADEVGLGKTLVARGVVAKTIDHLWDDIQRIDVVYICSNADIARQNINRLKVVDQEEFALASRITLLPTKLQDLKGHKLNFISFTPGTSFDLKTSLGIAEERALLYWLLDRAWKLRGTGALNVLQGYASKDNFRTRVEWFKSDPKRKIDDALADAFAMALERRVSAEQQQNRVDIRSRFEDLCGRFSYARKHIPPKDATDRAETVGELRSLLAATCLKALQPDLIILDEFQRFKHLIDGKDDASLLARELFEYQDARVLLLSATPYKMYTLAHEAANDSHYDDFLRTLRFLQQDEKESAKFERLLRQFRLELFRLGNGNMERIGKLKSELEETLRRVMVRTERLAVSGDRDGMLIQVPAQGVRLETRDLFDYTFLQDVSRLLRQDDTIEYWKSAPYLLNFMDGYELKRSVDEARINPEMKTALTESFKAGKDSLLDWSKVSAYDWIDPSNARLRGLLAGTVDKGAWRLLWVPPSNPYYELGGPFAEPELERFTKQLVFSSWRVVPKALASLLSYAAERLMMRSLDESPENSPEARRRRTPLLRFARAEGRLTGMPIFTLLYPSITLALHCDPFEIAAEAGQRVGLLTAEEVVDHARRRIANLLMDIDHPAIIGLEDESWYWAAPILLDLMHHGQETRDWFNRPDLASLWSGVDSRQEEDDSASAWHEHVAQARKLVDGQFELGHQPADLALVLAEMAVGAPGVTSMRALCRITDGLANEPALAVRYRAAQIAWAMHRLFNLPEVMALIRGINREEPYWRRVLDYCVEGGLQPTLDEYAHILRESLGLLGQPPNTIVSAVSEAMRKALTLRTASLGVDDMGFDQFGDKLSIDTRMMRVRFALRFGEDRADGGNEINRADQVREAFNSPFWPFVLATTSVGQEGLDFHHYCHAVVHWNLPPNPVDLEQREGRVHRYKGHAVRRNLAKSYGDASLKMGKGDPWEFMFAAAKRDRSPSTTDIVPFWVYPIEGGARIERHVPHLPLSREIDQLNSLRQSLAVYRMVLGQPRQEDLVKYLASRLPESVISGIIDRLQIDLSPSKGNGM